MTCQQPCRRRVGEGALALEKEVDSSTLAKWAGKSAEDRAALMGFLEKATKSQGERAPK